MLASEVLNSTITLGQDQGAGTGQATATGEAGQGTDVATATSDASQATAAPGATAEGTATAGTDSSDQGTSQGDMTLTIDDMIVNTTGESGQLLYLVITSTFGDGERWIPVPVSMLQWDVANNGFILNVDATRLQNAPSFQNGQYPDTTTADWASEFDTFWQNNGAGNGTGSGAEATATP